MEHSGNIPVIIQVGTGHAGTTMLGILLGRHPKIDNAGELSHFNRWSAAGELCACGLKLSECPFWKRVFPQKLYQPILYRYMSGFLAASDEYYDFDPTLNKEVKTDVPRYVADTEKTYEAIVRESGKPIIVDLCGSPDRAELLARHVKNIKPIFLHLVRDGRGYVNSNYKHVAGRPFFDQIRKWVAQNLKTEIMLRRNRNVPTLFMRYEDLVHDPEKQLRRVTDLLGVPFDPRMLEYSFEGQHTSAANPGNRAKQRVIREDLSWKRELTASQKFWIALLAGWLNIYYKLRS